MDKHVSFKRRDIGPPQSGYSKYDVYWASIDYIPKGIIDKIPNIFFSFFWTSKHADDILLVKWKTMANLKEL